MNAVYAKMRVRNGHKVMSVNLEPEGGSGELTLVVREQHYNEDSATYTNDWEVIHASLPLTEHHVEAAIAGLNRIGFVVKYSMDDGEDMVSAWTHSSPECIVSYNAYSGTFILTDGVMMVQFGLIDGDPEGYDEDFYGEK